MVEAPFNTLRYSWSGRPSSLKAPLPEREAVEENKKIKKNHPACNESTLPKVLFSEKHI
jgi:hypothetical protein